MKKVIVILATLVLVACPMGKVFADSFGKGSNYDYAQGGFTNNRHWTSYSIAGTNGIWARIDIVGYESTYDDGRGYAKAISTRQTKSSTQHIHTWGSL